MVRTCLKCSSRDELPNAELWCYQLDHTLPLDLALVCSHFDKEEIMNPHDEVTIDLDGVELKCSLLFKNSTEAERLATYNGIGPDHAPGWLSFVPDWAVAQVRDLLARWLPTIYWAVVIHDFDCTFMPKTRAGFDASNARFEYNCVALRNAVYDWLWNFRRYWRLRAATGFFVEMVALDAAFEGYENARPPSED